MLVQSKKNPMGQSSHDRGRWAKYFSLVCFTVLFSTSCYSPTQSQNYFLEATALDRTLQPLYSTSLYTVFFDFSLQRCVLHAAHTWGEGGGGAGGTGIGIEAFRCDPKRIRERALELGLKVHRPRTVVKNVSPDKQTGKPEKTAPPKETE